MYEDFFAERLSKLRGEKEISAREMSLSLGQNSSYVNRIENRKAFPSMQGFFYICEFLGVTPAEFFDKENEVPLRLREILEDLKCLDKEQLLLIQGIVREMKKGNGGQG